jgi:NADPH-dependent 2,4-dienoyl-CoA reductase/sulfur reductase-like enzyme
MVVGGGLLGLEAANALRGMGLSPHIVELGSRLLPGERSVEQPWLVGVGGRDRVGRVRPSVAAQVDAFAVGQDAFGA